MSLTINELTERLEVKFTDEYIDWCKKYSVRFTSIMLEEIDAPFIIEKIIPRTFVIKHTSITNYIVYLLSNQKSIGSIEISSNGTLAHFYNSPSVFSYFNKKNITTDSISCPKCGEESVRIGARFAYQCRKCSYVTGF